MSQSGNHQFSIVRSIENDLLKKREKEEEKSVNESKEALIDLLSMRLLYVVLQGRSDRMGGRR
jgi:hypothetical protein